MYNINGDFMAKLLALDLDGTLFYPKKRVRMIPKKNITFIQNFIDQGNRVVLCSGRNMPFAEKVIKKIERSVDVIGCNSAFIYSDGKYISQSMMKAPMVKNIVDELSEKFQTRVWLLMSKDQSLIIAGEMSLITQKIYKLVYAFQGVYAEKYIISNSEFEVELNKGEVYKLMMFFGFGKKGVEAACNANKYLRQHYGDQIEASWTGNFIEITAASASKSNGLCKYCEYHHIDADDVYVAGDSGNDISMFETFNEHSFCMSHASPKVKKFAKYEIDTVADIEKYIKEI